MKKNAKLYLVSYRIEFGCMWFGSPHIKGC